VRVVRDPDLLGGNHECCDKRRGEGSAVRNEAVEEGYQGRGVEGTGSIPDEGSVCRNLWQRLFEGPIVDNLEHETR